jgi:protein-disulfide isomerase
MHDALFAQQDSIGVKPWRAYAQMSGITDLAGFDQCMQHSDTAAVVRADIAAGTELRVNGTPVILIDSLEVDGYPGADQLAAYVNRVLEGAAKLNR